MAALTGFRGMVLDAATLSGNVGHWGAGEGTSTLGFANRDPIAANAQQRELSESLLTDVPEMAELAAKVFNGAAATQGGRQSGCGDVTSQVALRKDELEGLVRQLQAAKTSMELAAAIVQAWLAEIPGEPAHSAPLSPQRQSPEDAQGGHSEPHQQTEEAAWETPPGIQSDQAQEGTLDFGEGFSNALDLSGGGDAGSSAAAWQQPDAARTTSGVGIWETNQSTAPATHPSGATRKPKICLCGVSRPSFGPPGSSHGIRSAIWCSKCPTKPLDAVNVTNKRCECGAADPNFGFPGGKGARDARWCSACPTKPPEAVNVKSKRCECGRSSATLGLPGGKCSNLRWCAKCPTKDPSAISSGKRCECGASARIFGPRGGKRSDAKWCSKCPTRPPGTVDLVNKRCECGRTAAQLGYICADGRKEVRWCSKCPGKPLDATDVVHRRCECGASQPTFGFHPGDAARKAGAPPGRKFARWCSKCPNKPRDAVNVVSKNCECGLNQPTFCMPKKEGKELVRWCHKCKPPGADYARFHRKRKRGAI